MPWFQAVRPKLAVFKTIEEASLAVDEMFNLAFENAGRMCSLSLLSDILIHL